MTDRRDAWRPDTEKLREQFDSRRPSRDGEAAIDWEAGERGSDPAIDAPRAPAPAPPPKPAGSGIRDHATDEPAQSPFGRSRRAFASEGANLASLYSRPSTRSRGVTQLDAIQNSFVKRRPDTNPGDERSDPDASGDGGRRGDVPLALDRTAPVHEAVSEARSDDEVTEQIASADLLNRAWERSRAEDAVSLVDDRAGLLSPGDNVGSYVVREHLSEGGMGVVYLAEHALLGRKAALKVLLPEFSTNREFVKRFFVEAKALASIEHPGIVQVFDFGYHRDGNAFIVMELLRGESLERRIQDDERLRISEALSIVRDVAYALSAAHERGVIHRDLKPDNVFLVTDEHQRRGYRVVVLDFGLAKLADDQGTSIVQTRVGALMGTPAYMSPEQCRSVGRIDARADVYSLGCVLFRLLCGRPPFVADSQGDIIASHLREQPPAPSSIDPSIPSDIDAMVLRALAKEPELRQPDMATLAAELDGFASAYETGQVQALPPRGSSAGARSGGDAASSSANEAPGAGESLAVPDGGRRLGLLLGVIAVSVAALIAGAALALWLTG